ncbi:MAG: glycoside hydrolase family 97 protein [Candidatus Aminicenantaceae bacterium]
MLNKKRLIILPFIIVSSLTIMGCARKSHQSLSSPDNNINIDFSLREGIPHYSISYNQRIIIKPSSLGFQLAKSEHLHKDFKIIRTERKSVDEIWNPVWGKKSEVKNNYNQLIIELEEKNDPYRRLSLIFRAYDDGAAFRFSFPEQKHLSDFAIASEDTHFNFSENYTCYALQLGKYTTSYEKEFDQISLQDINQTAVIGLPLLLKTPHCWMGITEAGLTNYAGMYLSGADDDSTYLISKLSPLPGEEAVKVRASAPHDTPWRAILLGAQPGDLMGSNLIINLNDPNEFEDVSWIKPGLVLWPWWNGRLPYGEPHTAQMKYYIEFASKHGIPYLLVDAGWYSLERDAWREPDKENILTMEETRKDYYDIREVIDYAKEKNVGVHLWVHGASLKRQIDEALPVYAQWGAVGIKVDSYGRDDQEWVNFVHEIAKKASKYRLMVNYHGAYKPTGIRRTYPNIMTREGILGLEHSKWSKKPTSQHNVTIPFTRMLAGPMDYTPGAFDLDGTEKSPKYVQGTRAHQLAMYVVYFSPLQMIPDYPEAYENSPEEFSFIKSIPTVWDDTIVINGVPGDFISMARRRGEDWYLGIMTDENPRRLEIPLSFLNSGKKYVAQIYADALDDEENPERVIVSEAIVISSTVLKAEMKGGGGFTARLSPADKENIKRLLDFAAQQ